MTFYPVVDADYFTTEGRGKIRPAWICYCDLFILKVIHEISYAAYAL